jgi:hypothetical protein
MLCDLVPAGVTSTFPTPFTIVPNCKSVVFVIVIGATIVAVASAVSTAVFCATTLFEKPTTITMAKKLKIIFFILLNFKLFLKIVFDFLHLEQMLDNRSIGLQIGVQCFSPGIFCDSLFF